MNPFIKENWLTRIYAYLDNVTIYGMTQKEHYSNLKFLEAAENKKYKLKWRKMFSIKRLCILGYEVARGKISKPRTALPLMQTSKAQNKKVNLLN